MAHAVIGGIITSTVMTLLVVPVLYTYMDSLGAMATRWFTRNANVETAAAQEAHAHPGHSAHPTPHAGGGSIEPVLSEKHAGD